MIIIKVVAEERALERSRHDSQSVLERHADALSARVEELTAALEKCLEENGDLRSRSRTIIPGP